MPPTRFILDDSVASLVCPLCGHTRYVAQDFLDFRDEMTSTHPLIEASPRHVPCNALMHIIPFGAMAPYIHHQKKERTRDQ
jgi:hypothetical protein